MSSSEQSPFLHCLQQLNDDTWAQVLLPKLIEQGSVADVAQTCSQLRDLCNQYVEVIDLSSLAANADLGALEKWMQPLPARFPNCILARLKLAVGISYVGLQYMLPAIARWADFGPNCMLPTFVLHTSRYNWQMSALVLIYVSGQHVRELLSTHFVPYCQLQLF